ncbi:hypothetical protein BHE90_016151 [Fusarium euwallaceae]|uniref:Uncharacterized protein n=1 Tax=Fusarium euwallaceae TaxID=1147111 RepID=A0A430L182_9HYPO|nr:hypothetical protein BHE90_016151 [Fusarium euwallaceae]
MSFYELVLLWANAKQSASPSSRSSSEPPPEPEAAPEGVITRLSSLMGQTPHLGWPVYACLVALLAILIAFFASPTVHILYCDYDGPLLPLIKPSEHTNNPLLPLGQYSLIAALSHEPVEVSYGVGSWKGSSSLPGPETVLVNCINHCLRRSKPLQISYGDVYCHTNALINTETAVTLAYAINQGTSDRQIRNSIKGFGGLEETRTGHAVQPSWVLKKYLQAIRNDEVPIFTDVDQGLRPYIDDRPEKMDSRCHRRRRLLP